MKNIILLLSVFSLYHSIKAQIIHNKVNVYVTYGVGAFMGDELFEEEGFSTPSLFSNYSSLNAYSFKTLVALNGYIHYGLSLNIMKASGWESSLDNDYESSRLNQLYFAPILQISTPYKESGIFNRFKVFGEFSGVKGRNTLELSEELFESRLRYNPIEPYRRYPVPVKEIDSYLGISADMGVEYVVNRMFGIQLSYYIQKGRIGKDESLLYNDRDFTFSQLRLGLFLRFKKVKNIIY